MLEKSDLSKGRLLLCIDRTLKSVGSTDAATSGYCIHFFFDEQMQPYFCRLLFWYIVCF